MSLKNWFYQRVSGIRQEDPLHRKQPHCVERPTNRTSSDKVNTAALTLKKQSLDISWRPTGQGSLRFSVRFRVLAFSVVDVEVWSLTFWRRRFREFRVFEVSSVYCRV